ncbi:MAG: NB-ARC domain-containing protein, partial [Candidatus Saccharimonadales bacterium]
MDYAISAVRNTCFAILSSVELDLREMIAYAALRDGDVDVLPSDVRSVATQRFSSDRPGITAENDLDLLEYTDFADIAKMMHSRATALETEYGLDLSPVAERIARLAAARNRVCHSRPLEDEDLPQFLDLARWLLSTYSSLSWTELRKIQDAKAKDPAFILRLQIPTFLQASLKSIPHNLPYPDFDETSFLGRVAERREIKKHILGPHPVLTMVGEGGVGKTALAVHVLYELADSEGPQPFDSIVWISLKTKALTASGIADIRDCVTSTIGVARAAVQGVGAVGQEGETVEMLVDELLSYMAELRILLVIDNFETLAKDSLRPLLAAIPTGSKVVITSRVGLGEL